MPRRRKTDEAHVNMERWLVSYADFLTLLFAFFVVMYAISSVNEGKYRVLSASLVSAFRSSARSLQPVQIGKLSRSTVKNKNHVKLPAPPIQAPFAGYPVPSKNMKAHASAAAAAAGQDYQAIRLMAERIEQALSGLIAKKLVVIHRNPLWLEVQINTSVLFPSGSAEITPAAAKIIDRLGDILSPFPNRINVQGFTDNVPISTPEFPTNWELSAARAASVVRRMITYGVDPARLAATGYGEYHPVADNSTAEGRSQNRRVSLVILAAYTGDGVAPPYDRTTPAAPPAAPTLAASVP